jgi:hypothetical protein
MDISPDPEQNCCEFGQNLTEKMEFVWFGKE